MNALLAFLSAASLVNAHIRMLFPLPRGHPNNAKYRPVDYDLVAPLLSRPEKTFPCGGKPKGQPTATFKAGDEITVQLEGSAVHGGGHCQFALSCSGKDSGFIVIETVLDTCPIEKSYKVKIPKEAKGTCVFSWTWLNKIGNRELYQNCADIRIEGSGSGVFKGQPLTILNLPGFGTIPENGAAPYDKSGVPNFRYGGRSTENNVRGPITSNGAVDAVTAPAAAPVVASNPIPSTKPVQAPVVAPAPTTPQVASIQASKDNEEAHLVTLERIADVIKDFVDKVKESLQGSN